MKHLVATLILLGIIAPPFVIAQIEGELDDTFNIEGLGADERVHAIVAQPDGKVIIGGQFTTYNEVAAPFIARLNEDGSFDETFDPGTGPSNHVYAIAVQADGKVLVGGRFTSFDGVDQRGIARLHPNGELDTLFNEGGTGFSQYQNLTHMLPVVNAIAVQSDGHILVGGVFNRYNNTAERRNIARLNPDGSLAMPFILSGLSSDVEAIAILPDGRVLLGGRFTGNITRVTEEGEPDETFSSGSGFSASSGTARVRAMTVLPDGKIIAGGSFNSYQGQPANRLARLNSDGSFDSTFNPEGSGANSAIYTLTSQADGKIIIGGGFWGYNGLDARAIARVNPDGSLDDSFQPPVNDSWSTATLLITMAFQSDGKLLIGGNITEYNNNPIGYMARIFAGDAPLSTEQPSDVPREVLSVHPNPVAHSLHVDAAPNDELTIFDLQGRVVMRERLGQNLTLDVSGLPAGWYAISNGTLRAKFLRID